MGAAVSGYCHSCRYDFIQKTQGKEKRREECDSPSWSIHNF